MRPGQFTHAPCDKRIAELEAENAKLKASLERAEKALKEYANDEYWICACQYTTVRSHKCDQDLFLPVNGPSIAKEYFAEVERDRS